MPASRCARRTRVRAISLGVTVCLGGGAVTAFAARGRDAHAGADDPSRGASRPPAARRAAAPRPPAPGGAAGAGRLPPPTRVDTPWSPLVPGPQFVYVGKAARDDGRRP